MPFEGRLSWFCKPPRSQRIGRSPSVRSTSSAAANDGKLRRSNSVRRADRPRLVLRRQESKGCHLVVILARGPGNDTQVCPFRPVILVGRSRTQRQMAVQDSRPRCSLDAGVLRANRRRNRHCRQNERGPAYRPVTICNRHVANLREAPLTAWEQFKNWRDTDSWKNTSQFGLDCGNQAH